MPNFPLQRKAGNPYYDDPGGVNGGTRGGGQRARNGQASTAGHHRAERVGQMQQNLHGLLLNGVEPHLGILHRLALDGDLVEDDQENGVQNQAIGAFTAGHQKSLDLDLGENQLLARVVAAGDDCGADYQDGAQSGVGSSLCAGGVDDAQGSDGEGTRQQYQKAHSVRQVKTIAELLEQNVGDEGREDDRQVLQHGVDGAETVEHTHVVQECLDVVKDERENEPERVRKEFEGLHVWRELDRLVFLRILLLVEALVDLDESVGDEADELAEEHEQRLHVGVVEADGVGTRSRRDLELGLTLEDEVLNRAKKNAAAHDEGYKQHVLLVGGAGRRGRWGARCGDGFWVCERSLTHGSFFGERSEKV